MYRREEVAEMLTITVRKLDKMVAKGEGPPSITIGTRRMFPADKLDEWIAARLEATN
jgi:excisionase family DNA binding protein